MNTLFDRVKKLFVQMDIPRVMNYYDENTYFLRLLVKKIIAVCCLFINSLGYSESAGIVLFTVKQVTAQRNGAEVKLARGAQFYAGDAIITAADATAKIRFTNGTLVTIGSDSNYKILAYAPNQSEVLKANLSKGKIESQSVGTQKRESLKTPIVAIAIAGTHFKVFVADLKKTNVELESGHVKVGETNLSPGESVVATPEGIRPQAFPEIGNIPMTVELREAGGYNDSNTPSSTVGDTKATANTSSDAMFLLTTTVVGEEVTNSVSAVATVTPQMTFSITCP